MTLTVSPISKSARTRVFCSVGADEAGDAGGVLDERPGVVGHLHLHEHVSREDATLGLDLLAVLRLDDLLGRDHDLAHHVPLPGGQDAVLQIVLHLGLMAGVGVDDVPVEQVG